MLYTIDSFFYLFFKKLFIKTKGSISNCINLNKKSFLKSLFHNFILLLVPSHNSCSDGVIYMRRNKKERQRLLKETIEKTPFITDEELAEKFEVSIQTIRLDRLELSIPELRERIKHVAEQNLKDEVRSLPIDEVIGEIIDLNLDESAISIFEVKKEHVFSRNQIARGHHLFAQANSLAVAVIDDELALTKTANIRFTRQVKENERVVAKAKVKQIDHQKGRTFIEVNSFVGKELVFSGEFEMYRSKKHHKKEGTQDETSD